MTGILVLASTGLILGETAETYPNGWTFAQSGTATASAAASAEQVHSGADSFDVQTGSSWPSGAYAKLTKTVDLLTGANRICRLFRGATITGGLYDHFVGSALDATRWGHKAGTPSPPVSGSVVTLRDPNYDYQLSTSGLQEFRPHSGHIRVIARIKLGTTSNIDICWFPFTDNISDYCLFDWSGDDGLVISIFNGTTGYNHSCGAIDTNWHTYECDWWVGGVSFYRDGALLATTTTTYPHDTDGHYSLFRSQSYTYYAYCDWVGVSCSGAYQSSLKLGSQTVFDVNPAADSNPIDNTFYDDTNGWAAVTATGSQTVEVKVRNNAGYEVTGKVHLFFDDLIIMADKIITIEGLLGGQKVELYNAGGVLLASGTCPGIGSNITLGGYDLSSQIKTAYGLSGYFKVYNTDGVTLLYTSPTLTIFGGDLYNWCTNQSTLAITTNVTQIYRTGSGLSPTTATITATLTNTDTGAPISSKTVTFTPNLGTCSPTSGTTDAYGNVSTTYTAGSAAGLSGVRADFAGDATYGASSIQQLIDIYYGAITVDAAKDFQVFLEGQELVIATGNYKLSADFIPQPFTVVTPILNAAVGGWWYIEIYRLGVKEFGGRVLKRSRVSGPNPSMTITGVDEKIDLQRRVANGLYIDDPKNIINALLTQFPCGVTAGAISLYGATINLPATYTNLFDALTQITNVTGWKFRLNANRTLDFAPSFGVVKAITIQTGGVEATAQHDEDWTKIDTKVYVVGGATAASLVGVASSPSAQLTYGLIEESFLEKSLTDLGTVNLRAQQLLSTKVGVLETIPVDWIDANPTGTYGPFDIVTVIDSDLNLSGGYAVSTLQRDLTDAYKASLNLTNRVLSIADALQEVRKNVQDMGVL